MRIMSIMQPSLLSNKDELPAVHQIKRQKQKFLSKRLSNKANFEITKPDFTMYNSKDDKKYFMIQSLNARDNRMKGVRMSSEFMNSGLASNISNEKIRKNLDQKLAPLF